MQKISQFTISYVLLKDKYTYQYNFSRLLVTFLIMRLFWHHQNWIPLLPRHRKNEKRFRWVFGRIITDKLSNRGSFMLENAHLSLVAVAVGCGYHYLSISCHQCSTSICHYSSCWWFCYLNLQLRFQGYLKIWLTGLIQFFHFVVVLLILKYSLNLHSRVAFANTAINTATTTH